MGKKVLGLDLGVGSIGWCLITLDKDEKPIIRKTNRSAPSKRSVPLGYPLGRNEA